MPTTILLISHPDGYLLCGDLGADHGTVVTETNEKLFVVNPGKDTECVIGFAGEAKYKKGLIVALSSQLDHENLDQSLNNMAKRIEGGFSFLLVVRTVTGLRAYHYNNSVFEFVNEPIKAIGSGAGNIVSMHIVKRSSLDAAINSARLLMIEALDDVSTKRPIYYYKIQRNESTKVDAEILIQ